MAAFYPVLLYLGVSRATFPSQALHREKQRVRIIAAFAFRLRKTLTLFLVLQVRNSAGFFFFCSGVRVLRGPGRDQLCCEHFSCHPRGELLS